MKYLGFPGIGLASNTLFYFQSSYTETSIYLNLSLLTNDFG